MVLIWTPPAIRRGGAIEVQAGIALLDDLATELSVGYVYQFTGKFSWGLWIGMYLMEDGPLRLVNSDFVPSGGLKYVFGNKVDGWAFSANIGMLPGLGVYYRNFFLDLSLIPVSNGELYASARIGYSFYFGQ